MATDYDYVLIKEKDIEQYTIDRYSIGKERHEIVATNTMRFKSEELLQYLKEKKYGPTTTTSKISVDSIDSLRYCTCDNINAVSTNLKQINNKEKEKNCMKILEIYKDIEEKKIHNNCDKKIQEILDKSEIGKLVKKLQKEANKELEKIIPNYKELERNFIDVCYEDTVEIKEQKEKI